MSTVFLTLGLTSRAISTNFADTQARRSESHAILDFTAGKDVGLGMFGRDSTSTLSLGVRFAQFASKSAFNVSARPDLQFKYYAIPYLPYNVQISRISTPITPRDRPRAASAALAHRFHGTARRPLWAISKTAN